MTAYDDLKVITNQSDWFATIAIPAPSKLDDSQARFELEWRNARRQLSPDWDDDELDRGTIADGSTLTVRLTDGKTMLRFRRQDL